MTEDINLTPIMNRFAGELPTPSILDQIDEELGKHDYGYYVVEVNRSAMTPEMIAQGAVAFTVKGKSISLT